MASNSSRDADVRLLSQLVGRQLRRARIRRDLTEAALAKRIGGTTDQIIGYEEGGEPPDLARLAELAAALEVPLAQLIGSILDPEAEAEAVFENDEGRREAIRLVRSFGLIEDERIRKSFVEWVEAIAASTRKPDTAASTREAEPDAARKAPEPDASARQSGPAAPAGKPDPGGPAGRKQPGGRRK
jgi:transcriptional regulator with XRE-family HTH domain